jgi:hypothetical protein
MNPKNSLWQFIKDGLVGVAIGLIPIGIFMGIRLFNGFFSDVGALFFFPNPIISPMSFVFLIGFISMGIGGRFLENITSRWSWIKPILIIAVIAWTIGILLSQILFIEFDFFDWIVLGITLGITALGAGAGFIIAGLAGVIFNPTKRLFRIIIGAIASTVVSYAVVFWIVLFSSQS